MYVFLLAGFHCFGAVAIRFSRGSEKNHLVALKSSSVSNPSTLSMYRKPTPPSACMSCEARSFLCVFASIYQ